MVGSEERFWLSNAFCMSHTWILDPGHHFFFCVWIFVFIVNGARTSSILEDRRGVGFFGWICFQPQFQPKFSGGISSSIARAANFVPRHPSSRPLRSPPSSRPHSIARAARAPIAPTPPPARRARALYARLPRRVHAPSRAPPPSFPARRSR